MLYKVGTERRGQALVLVEEWYDGDVYIYRHSNLDTGEVALEVKHTQHTSEGQDQGVGHEHAERDAPERDQSHDDDEDATRREK